MGRLSGSDRIWFTWLRLGKPARTFSIPGAWSGALLAAATLTPGLAGAAAAGWVLRGSLSTSISVGDSRANVTARTKRRRIAGGPVSLTAPSPQPGTATPTTPVDHAHMNPIPHAVCSGRKPADEAPFSMRVALTFDDGPDLVTTPAILAILRDQQLPATFFLNGEKISSVEHERLVREIASNPLISIGNHGWSHSNLSRIPLGEVVTEVGRTEQRLAALGVAPNFFRFPFGHASCEAQQLIEARGLRIAGWHVSSADWCYAERDGWCRSWRYRYIPQQHRRDMVGYVMRQLKRTKGGIVLLHDRLPYTVEQLPRLLAEMREQGFQFVRLDDSNVFPRLNSLGPVAGR